MTSFKDISSSPELVEIERGYFRMGSDKAIHQMYIDETPARELSIERRFAAGKYPVTFQELLHFIHDELPSSPLRPFVEEWAKAPERLPAVMVSSNEARMYCRWLSETTGQVYRLLTESEWEYVCRAGTQTDYWWGDQFDPDQANSRYQDIQRSTFRLPESYGDARLDLHYLTPVDKYGANPWGLFDLHGNTWEWVEDAYEDRRTKPELRAPMGGRDAFRCIRGGSWMDPPLSLRSAARSWADPTAKDRIIGFRVARNL